MQPIELPFLLDEEANPVSLERAKEISDAFAQRDRNSYWAEFSSTDDGELDAQLIRLEDDRHTLPVILRICRQFKVVATYGNDEGPRGSVTRDGVILGPGQAEP